MSMFHIYPVEGEMFIFLISFERVLIHIFLSSTWFIPLNVYIEIYGEYNSNVK